MSIRNSRERYGAIAQLFHWLVVVLLIVQYILAESAEELPEGLEQFAMLARHKSVGITILGLALLRVVWRLVDRPPPMPAMPAWQRAAAFFNHWALYLLLFAMPLTGWMMSSAANYPVTWFGVFQLPDLVGQSEELEEFFHEAHEILFGTLVALAVLHILAAFKHQFIDGDGLMSRMLPWRGSRR